MTFKTEKLVPIAVIIIALYLVWSYAINLPANDQVEILIRAIPIFLGIAFFSIIALIIWNRKEIVSSFSGISRKVWFAVLAIVVVALFLHAFVAPLTHRLYFDEDIYANIGQNILTEGKGILCNRGLPQGPCYDYILNKQPMGHQFLFAVVYALFGVNELPAHIMTMLVGALASVFLFMIAYLLTKRASIGLFAGLLLALTPIVIHWSATMAAEMYHLFFTLMSMSFLIIYVQQTKQKTKTLLLAAVSFAYALQLRPEGYLILVPAALILLFYDKNLKNKISDFSFLLPIILMFILIFPTITHTTSAISKDPWGSSGKVFSTEYLNKNISDNTGFFFENNHFPLFFTLFAVLGAAVVVKYKQYKLGILLAVWFFVFFIIYGLFYAGSFNYGVDERFSETLYPSLLIFAGIGLYAIHKSLANALSYRIKAGNIIAAAIVVILVLVVWSPLYGYSSSIGEQAFIAREQHKLAYESMSEIPKNCIILDHVPSIWLVMGYPSMQTWYGQNSDVMSWAFNMTDCVIFYEAYWCGSEPYKSTVCDNMHKSYDLEVFKQRNLSTPLTIYKVYRKS